ncbi:prolyl endopeptidase [Klebsiella pneumoniae]|uniref:Prolyl endopeptidase n=1 Tax=Klebsiella pneumoniae TaxID=573 RepID=A0A378F5M9_KLEPN|nr:prolyl endopeptidase [Klebsiella pneumoniae]
MSFCHMRIARPVSELDTTASMYCAGLGLELLGSFTDHEGFSGIMLGRPKRAGIWNSPTAATIPSPPRQAMKICWCCTIHSRAAWEAQCAAMDAAGFLRVTAFNPYWRSMASLSSTGTATARYCKTAPGEKYEALPIKRRINNLPICPAPRPARALWLFRPQPRRHREPGQQPFRTEQSGDRLSPRFVARRDEQAVSLLLQRAVAAARSRTSNSIHACGTGSVSATGPDQNRTAPPAPAATARNVSPRRWHPAR